MIRDAYITLSWRLKPLVPFALAVGIAVMLGSGMLWLSLIEPPPSQRINIPYQWSCASKDEGGFCVRTGGYDAKGRPWGTAIPKWPKGTRVEAPGGKVIEAASPG